jgi:hypothetical protein
VPYLPFKKHRQAHADKVRREVLEVFPEGFQRKFSELYGIVCFNAKSENLLMWSHYASSHQGFMVEFDPNHNIFDPTAFGQVSYSSKRPSIEEVPYWRLLLTKSPEWSYECEYRLIKDLRKLETAKRRDGRELPCTELPAGAVRAVYIGCRMLSDDRHELLNGLSEDCFGHVKRFVMKRHWSEYAIEPVPLDQEDPVPEDAKADFERIWEGLDASKRRN